MDISKPWSCAHCVAMSLIRFLYPNLTWIRLNFEELASLLCRYTIHVAMAGDAGLWSFDYITSGCSHGSDCRNTNLVILDAL